MRKTPGDGSAFNPETVQSPGFKKIIELNRLGFLTVDSQEGRKAHNERAYIEFVCTLRQAQFLSHWVNGTTDKVLFFQIRKSMAETGVNPFIPLTQVTTPREHLKHPKKHGLHPQGSKQILTRLSDDSHLTYGHDRRTFTAQKTSGGGTHQNLIGELRRVANECAAFKKDMVFHEYVKELAPYIRDNMLVFVFAFDPTVGRLATSPKGLFPDVLKNMKRIPK